MEFTFLELLANLFGARVESVVASVDENEDPRVDQGAQLVEGLHHDVGKTSFQFSLLVNSMIRGTLNG
jgi:hypothetical protein